MRKYAANQKRLQFSDMNNKKELGGYIYHCLLTTGKRKYQRVLVGTEASDAEGAHTHSA